MLRTMQDASPAVMQEKAENGHAPPSAVRKLGPFSEVQRTKRVKATTDDVPAKVRHSLQMSE